jgi:hypothetical protein
MKSNCTKRIVIIFNFLCLLLTALSPTALGQINEGGTYQFFTCKDRSETYVYYGGTSDPNLIYCYLTWKVEGGVFVDNGNATTLSTYTDPSTGISSMKVKWTTDNPTGVVSVTTNNCSNGSSSRTITFQKNPTTITASPSMVAPGAQTTLTANPQYASKSYTWSSTAGGGLNAQSGKTVTANPTAASTYTVKVNFDATLQVNFQTVKVINCNALASKSVTLTPPLANNSISNSGSASFNDAGDPAVLNGSTPTGGSGNYTYQWQSSVGTPNSFTNISGATGKDYDPPVIQYTTYFRRIATSGSLTSTSNVLTVTIIRTGATMNNPINIGDIGMCSSYQNTVYAFPELGYGNDWGNASDDVFYRFNLTTRAKISLANCKTDGVSGTINLLDTSGNIISPTVDNSVIGGCDVGYDLVFHLDPGVYYIVSEGMPNETFYLPVFLQTVPIFSTSSSNVTIVAGSSTTLQAFGTGATYSWSPSTGLSATTGATVTAAPAVTTTYTVRAAAPGGCADVKSITVNVTGSVGSTFNNPLIANIGGCGYYSGMINPAGYGNEYGGASEDLYYKFTLASASEVSISAMYAQNNIRLVLLNSAGSYMDEQLYSWVDSGDDAGTYILVLNDGTPLKPTLQPGTYYVVAEGYPGNSPFAVGIETPAGYSCREATHNTAYDVEGEEYLGATAFPNPATGDVTLSLAKGDPAIVHFVSATGVNVKQVSTAGKSTVININDVPAGLYLLRIFQGNTVRQTKLIVAE